MAYGSEEPPIRGEGSTIRVVFVCVCGVVAVDLSLVGGNSKLD